MAADRNVNGLIKTIPIQTIPIQFILRILA